VNIDDETNRDAYDYASKLLGKIKNDSDKKLFKENVLDKILAKRSYQIGVTARRAARTSRKKVVEGIGSFFSTLAEGLASNPYPSEFGYIRGGNQTMRLKKKK
jgi:hypothetical protein